MSDNRLIASVVLDLALEKPLDYLIPDDLKEKILPGSRVSAPVRKSSVGGTVIEIKTGSGNTNLKPIHEMTGEPALTKDLLQLAHWMAGYYSTHLQSILRMMLPASVRRDDGHQTQWFVSRLKTREELIIIIPELRAKAPIQAALLEMLLKVKKGMLLTELLEKTKASRSSVDALAKKKWISLEKIRIDRSPLEGEEYFLTSPKELNSQQRSAFEQLCQSLDQRTFHTHLIYGITGSGKTEVYLQAIEKTLAQGRSAIMMVPEIALTAQTIERFRCRFDNKISILHHRLSDGEKFDAWQNIRRGESRIVIGARSSIFCPLPDLGLIIVDEEHENSYKQSEQAPCYNARDVAVMRGKLCSATVVLGSATPSLESYHNAIKGKYTLSTLSIRADQARLPKITLVDMRKEYEKAKNFTSFSDTLLDATAKRLERGEQVIYFLNRRGYHTMLLCKQCGLSVKCSQCDTSMTFHLGDNCLSCHLCGDKHSPSLRHCPSCKQESTMKFRGVGTEHIERSLHAIFPEIRTLRIDADTTKHKGSHQRLLREFGTGKADVLIGTQMIAKGLHFPEVTLVGVLNCDSSLNIPDFRAAENSFQILSQVGGRAGRGAVEGEVIIQTSIPENSVIQHAANNNFEAFFKEELETRKIFNYPPFSQLAKITFSGAVAENVAQHAEAFQKAMRSQLPSAFDFFPVIPSGHAKVKNKFRFQFIVRGPSVNPISAAYQRSKTALANKAIAQNIDVNPYSTFF